MSDRTFLNFAYGSNMPTLRIQERCPSARFVGVASLSGYELHWHKPSWDGSGKCDVVQTFNNGVVWGVVFEIPLAEKASLDTHEGLGKGYSEAELQVNIAGQKLNCQAYIATKTDSLQIPYTWYKELVVLGAVEHGLPEFYLHQIQSVAAKFDSNDERRLEKEALVERVRIDVSSRATSNRSNFS